MAELVDAVDSKSAGRKVVRVQVPLCPPEIKKEPKALYFILNIYLSQSNPSP